MLSTGVVATITAATNAVSIAATGQAYYDIDGVESLPSPAPPSDPVPFPVTYFSVATRITLPLPPSTLHNYRYWRLSCDRGLNYGDECCENSINSNPGLAGAGPCFPITIDLDRVIHVLSHWILVTRLAYGWMV